MSWYIDYTVLFICRKTGCDYGLVAAVAKHFHMGDILILSDKTVSNFRSIFITKMLSVVNAFSDVFLIELAQKAV